MVITESQIRRIMPSVKNDKVKEFVRSFGQYSEDFGINTKIRVCYFLGQIAWESNELNAVEENLNYSTAGLLKTFPKYFKTRAEAIEYARKPEKIANRVYANRYGNGNEASGDGWRYKGRGLIQLTFKANYLAYQNSGYCVGNLIAHPEWLAQYPGALKSAMWYWKSHGCNEYADRDDINEVTRRVNGGYSHLAQRAYYTRVAKKVFGI